MDPISPGATRDGKICWAPEESMILVYPYPTSRLKIGSLRGLLFVTRCADLVREGADDFFIECSFLSEMNNMTFQGSYTELKKAPFSSTCGGENGGKKPGCVLRPALKPS
jgi:hypothetical protein